MWPNVGAMADEGRNRRPNRHELVAYLHVQHVALFERLAHGLSAVLDGHDQGGLVTEQIRQTRADLTEAVERLTEARQRGPGVP
jgi:hypothetical protein